MTTKSDAIAHAVLNQFRKLPQKRKPAVRDNGLHDWVPLSGIVAEKDDQMICLALATGMKCLPSAKLVHSRGVALHDWHAEILAIRTFNRFLLDECQKLLAGNDGCGIVMRRDPGEMSGPRDSAICPFEIDHRVKLHMYCSEAPCGDGSMELIMAAQEDALPWEAPSEEKQEAGREPDSLPGRAYFSQLGVVRRKPARGDAPPTLSKSCSDKLALKQCTSLLNSLTSLFIIPASAYINTLILPASQFSELACQRAFSSGGRMQSMIGSLWPGGYEFHPFSVETTEVEFEYSRRALQAQSSSLAASNLAAAWSFSGFDEGIIGGVLQGRKAFDSKGASRMSRRLLWMLARKLAGQMDGLMELEVALASETYQEVKDGLLLACRRTVKDGVRSSALTGWIRNMGDSDFSISQST